MSERTLVSVASAATPNLRVTCDHTSSESRPDGLTKRERDELWAALWAEDQTLDSGDWER